MSIILHVSFGAPVGVFIMGKSEPIRAVDASACSMIDKDLPDGHMAVKATMLYRTAPDSTRTSLPMRVTIWVPMANIAGIVPRSAKETPTGAP